MTEAIILCEGFFDRAFWSGWLRHLGCTVPLAGGMVFDPSGKRVERGQYGFHSKFGDFIRVVPCGGKEQLKTETKRRIKERLTARFRNLIASMDSDENADGKAPVTSPLQAFFEMVKSIEPNAKQNPDGDVLVDAGVTVSLILWQTLDPPGPGLPARQTLERLACACLVDAYPPRVLAVQS